VNWSVLDLRIGYRCIWILIKVLSLWFTFVALHYKLIQHVNVTQIVLSFFTTLNFRICLWEIALGLRIDESHQRHLDTRKVYQGREIEFALETLAQPTTLRNLFSPSYWGQIWSTYAIFDPAYGSRKSFGFFIDVGNGWTTLLPSFLFLFGMTFDISQLMSTQTFALVSLCAFYQAWYGTLVYFLTFFFNGRHKVLPAWTTFVFVGCTNGIWLTLPVLGMHTCVKILTEGNFQVFGRAH